MSRIFQNPVLQGFYPDPSICRVNEDFYLVTSTFEYFPGLPVFHSRDLVCWQQIGHVLDRPSQLNLDKIRPSGGLYAPTIRYHNNTFYVINTLVDGQKQSGNFIVTAAAPQGPWSEPFWLEHAPGIDPSLFFDDDGRAWYVGSSYNGEGYYPGHCEVWLQELDLNRMQLTGEKYILSDGAFKKAVWAEGPHIYKINGNYYLMYSEGGTGHEHSLVICRSSKITGPYEINIRNPILTHRHLGLNYPVTSTGHADLVETQNGQWWLVLLATRPYGGGFYNLGRETFLAQVKWEDGWPVVNPGSGSVQLTQEAPDLPQQFLPSKPACDHFEAQSLDFSWNFLRTPRENFYSLTQRPGFLRLSLMPVELSQLVNPSFIGRRQQHINFAARCAMEFSPCAQNECAGIVLLQNNDFHFRFVITGGENPTTVLICRNGGIDNTIASLPVTGNRFYFKIEAVGQAYSFYIAEKSEQWQLIAKDVDGRVLSTQLAGGFTGAYIGMYASSNGKSSLNYADFDWFEYQGMRE